jgi:hypothetical protein
MQQMSKLAYRWRPRRLLRAQIAPSATQIGRPSDLNHCNVPLAPRRLLRLNIPPHATIASGLRCFITALYLTLQ